MRTRRTFLAILSFAFACAITTSAVRAQGVSVAAAADLKFAVTELVSAYERQSDNKINVTYGSSGNFFTQLQNGAPFDLFFSADVDYARKLDAAGLAEPGTLTTYAIGRIVLWAPADSPLDLSPGWKVLLDDRVKKIAIANPAHAPYGRAAVAAMQKAGVYDQAKPKFVFGENISQTAQFVQSRNAQVGVVALSLALSSPMKSGKRWEISADTYPPIEQAAVVMKSAKNKSAARAFLAFVNSATAQVILANYGFSFPKP